MRLHLVCLVVFVLCCACDPGGRASDAPTDTASGTDTASTVDAGDADDTTPSIDLDASAADTTPAPSCKPTPMPLADAVQLPALDVAFVVPTGFTVREHPGTAAVTFDDPQLGAFGWIAELEIDADDPNQANGLALLAVGMAGQLPTVDFSKRHTFPGADWSNDVDVGELPGWRGVRAQMRFMYGEGQPNEKLDALPAARLRDIVVSALDGEVFDSGVDSAPCQTVSVHWHSRWRPETGTVLVSGVAACEAQLGEREDLRHAFDTVLAGNHLAPAGFVADRAHCQQLESPPPPHKIDVLALVDNSASMADEHEALSGRVDRMITEFEGTKFDWRLAVATTDAWAIDSTRAPLPGTERPDLSYDELLDPVSGLRAPGFIAGDAPDARSLIRRNILEDAGCQAMAGDPPQPVGRAGENLCGSHDERILLSLEVLHDRLPTSAPDVTEPFARRDRTDLIVIVLTDEADADAELAGFEPYDSDYNAFVDQWAEWLRDNGVDLSLVSGAQPCEVAAVGVVEPTRGASAPGVLRDIVFEVTGAARAICQEGDTFSFWNDGPSYRSHPLDAWPVTDSIHLSIDGVAVPRSTSQGWSYNADTNSVLLHGRHDLTHESDLRVGYMTWQRAAD